MKFLLLASFVLFCTASTVYRNRNISVNDDGNIVITSATGRRVVISRELGNNGQRNIDIAVSGPNIPSRRIQVNDNTLEDAEIGNGNTQWSSIDSVGEESRLKRGSFRSQGDVLTQILREYEGAVDEPQYERLLYRIRQAARRGEISPQVYDLLEGLDQQQQQQQFQQQDAQFGQQLAQGQGQFYGYGSRYGYGGYGYGAVPFAGRQSQVYQTPIGSYFYSQYLDSTPNVNPLTQWILPATQGRYYGLLANQRFNGGFQSALSGLGYQTVPQRTFSSGVLGGNRAFWRQILGNQQIPFGQSQFAASLSGVPYGVQQTISQFRRIPQTVFQQQSQIEQQNEVEQTIEQLVRVQQQIQQQQQIVQEYIAQQAIEQLFQVQQQQQQVGQFNGVQQTSQALQLLTQVQQQIQQQQRIGLLPRIQQAIQVIEQLYELQQQVPQQRQIGQLSELRQVIQQLYEIQQLQQQQQQIAQLVQQLVQIQQQQGLGQLTGLGQPLGQLYQQQQQIAQLIAQVNQIQQQQGYGQQQGQLAGLRQPFVQLYGQQQQQIAQLVEELNQIQQQQQQEQQQQPFGQGYRQQYGQYRSGPVTLQQLIGFPQTRTAGRYQQAYRGYQQVQPAYTQVRGSNYLNTVPQVQVVY